MHINENHQIVVDDGEEFHFQEIPAHPKNYDSKPTRPLVDPEFIIMHYTGGTNMQSTINTFTSAPKDESSAASAHLLVGRDGSVVQFVRFNRTAYHTGFAWWEQQENLNYCSIGIELDNLGELVRKDNHWKPRRLEDIIPDDDVQQSEYWKSPLPAGNRDDPDYASKLPGFQKFTDAQLAVALNIVRTLVKQYPSIKEILGHDQINIANRNDPGPLLPLSAWRKELFGREQPVIDEYIINQPTELYANVDGELPNTDQSAFPKPLPKDSQVKAASKSSLFEDVGGLTKVTVTKSAVKGTGWVRSNTLKPLTHGPDKQRITSIEQTFFKAGERPPTLKVNQASVGNSGLRFQAGTRVRIQKFQAEWALVAMLDRINGNGIVDNDHGQGGLDGWMPKDFVSQKT